MTRSPSGPLLFARYAYPPNRLGYCGPDAAAELLGASSGGSDDRALRHLAEQFEGAMPYLRLIANANGLADPLGARVVEAYWTGNELLRAVRARDFGRLMEDRFRGRVGGTEWRWLAGKPSAGALPSHAFHVLDVFPRVGLLRSGSAENVLQTIDACRIRWGRITARDGDDLIVDAVPLVMRDGRLQLGPTRAERIRAWPAGAEGLPRIGDDVSIHWDWACERLDQRKLHALERSTMYELALANATM